jgi:hypothetical protein
VLHGAVGLHEMMVLRAVRLDDEAGRLGPS